MTSSSPFIYIRTLGPLALLSSLRFLITACAPRSPRVPCVLVYMVYGPYIAYTLGLRAFFFISWHYDSGADTLATSFCCPQRGLYAIAAYVFARLSFATTLRSPGGFSVRWDGVLPLAACKCTRGTRSMERKRSLISSTKVLVGGASNR